jgi:hypothetical protein
MTQFWPEYPKSPYTRALPQFKWLPEQYDGNAEAQIRAVRDYLLTLKGGPSPRRNGGGAVTAN